MNSIIFLTVPLIIFGKNKANELFARLLHFYFDRKVTFHCFSQKTKSLPFTNWKNLKKMCQ